MNILVVADPLVTFKTYKDTTFAMMRELQKRGHTLAACEPEHLQWQSGQPVTARMCCSNWSTAQPSWVQWPVLWTRGAISLTTACAGPGPWCRSAKP